MKNFVLSKNTNYPFELFGIQHNIVLLITFILFIALFVFRKHIYFINKKNVKLIRFIMGAIILSNMLFYRVSYIYYGVYNIKIHLSLYYCHIINYLFVLILYLDYKPFYKIVYILAYIGCVWVVFFPSLSEGFDCFIFYSIFISHNLLLFFTTLMLYINQIKINFIKDIKYCIIALLIVLFTYVVNHDFGTNFNEPNWPILNFLGPMYLKKISLIPIGVFGYIIGYIINKFYYIKGGTNEKDIF